MKDIYVNKEMREEQEINGISFFKASLIIIAVFVTIIASMCLFMFFTTKNNNSNVEIKTEETRVISKQPQTSGDYTYEFNFSEADNDVVTSITITKFSGTGDIIEIPKKLNGYPITRIGNSCFAGNNMASITIPASVVEIENFAFYKCENLRIVQFENDNSKMNLVLGDSAFVGCKQLLTVTFPHSVLTIGSAAFQGCEKLVDVTYNYNCYLTIGMCAFQKCNLKKVVLPKNIEKIGNYAFEDNYNINAFVIPYGCEVGKDITKKTYTNNTTHNNNESIKDQTEASTDKQEENTTTGENYSETDVSESTKEQTTRHKWFAWF